MSDFQFYDGKCEVNEMRSTWIPMGERRSRGLGWRKGET